MTQQIQIQQLETLINETKMTINNYKQELKYKEIDLEAIIQQLTQIKNQTPWLKNNNN